MQGGSGKRKAGLDQLGLIAMGMENGSVSVWDLQRGVVSLKLGKGQQLPAVTDVAFSSNGRGLFTSSLEREVLEWDLEVLHT